MPFSLGFWAAAGAGGGAAGAYELISTTVLGSATTGVSFTSVPNTYKHLQLRVVARNNSSGASTVKDLVVYFNNQAGDTIWRYHSLFGNASSVSSTSGNALGAGAVGFGLNQSTIYGTSIIDILDNANTSKNTTVRSLAGVVGLGGPYRVGLLSGVWLQTPAVTQINLEIGEQFSIGSRFSLYGMR
jgi:hypothetical protein